jgi:hypothetical protein
MYHHISFYISQMGSKMKSLQAKSTAIETSHEDMIVRTFIFNSRVQIHLYIVYSLIYLGIFSLLTLYTSNSNVVDMAFSPLLLISFLMRIA